MLLSVVITHHHTPRLLNSCLQSLAVALENIKHEIIVCDNQCQKKDCLSHSWPKVQFCCFNQNLGYTRLVNYGLRQARGDYFLILNADTLVPPDSIELMYDYLSRHPRVGLLGPRLLDADHGWQPSCFREQTFLNILARRTLLGRTKRGKKLISRLCYQDSDLDQIQPVGWLMGSALLATRKTLDQIGYLDERFLMYFSDADWARRSWQAGLKVVYFPKAQIIHLHQRSSNRGHGIFDIFYNRMTRIHIRDAIRYFLKWRKNLFIEFLSFSF